MLGLTNNKSEPLIRKSQKKSKTDSKNKKSVSKPKNTPNKTNVTKSQDVQSKNIQQNKGQVDNKVDQFKKLYTEPPKESLVLISKNSYTCQKIFPKQVAVLNQVHKSLSTTNPRLLDCPDLGIEACFSTAIILMAGLDQEYDATFKIYSESKGPFLPATKQQFNNLMREALTILKIPREYLMEQNFLVNEKGFDILRMTIYQLTLDSTILGILKLMDINVVYLTESAYHTRNFDQDPKNTILYVIQCFDKSPQDKENGEYLHAFLRYPRYNKCHPDYIRAKEAEVINEKYNNLKITDVLQLKEIPFEEIKTLRSGTQQNLFMQILRASMQQLYERNYFRPGFDWRKYQQLILEDVRGPNWKIYHQDLEYLFLDPVNQVSVWCDFRFPTLHKDFVNCNRIHWEIQRKEKQNKPLEQKDRQVVQDKHEQQHIPIVHLDKSILIDKPHLPVVDLDESIILEALLSDDNDINLVPKSKNEKVQVPQQASQDHRLLITYNDSQCRNGTLNINHNLIKNICGKYEITHSVHKTYGFQSAYDQLMSIKNFVVKQQQFLQGQSGLLITLCTTKDVDQCALYYNEAVVQKFNGMFAKVDFQALSATSALPRGSDQQQQIKLYTYYGPMDYLNQNILCSIQIGYNVCLQLVTKMSDCRTKFEQFSQTTTVKLNDDTVYCRNQYLGMVSTHCEAHLEKTAEERAAWILDIRRRHEFFYLNTKKNSNNYDPFQECSLLFKEAMACHQVQKLKNDALLENFKQKKQLQGSKSCFDWMAQKAQLFCVKTKVLLCCLQWKATHGYSALDTEEQTLEVQYSVEQAQLLPLETMHRVIGGSNSATIHVVNHEKYLSLDYNQVVLRDLKFYNIESGDEIKFKDSGSLYNYYNQYCTCKRNQNKYQLLPLENYAQIQHFQYGNCPVNLISGILGRQCSSKLFPSYELLQQFKTFAQNSDLLKSFTSKSMHSDGFQPVTFKQYYEHVKETDAPKARKYDVAYQQFMSNQFQDITMECFPKTGEWNMANVNVDAYSLSARPRNICNINDQIKAVGGLVNYNLMNRLKQTSDFYLGNYDSSAKAAVINETYKTFKDPVFISNDGSSHDSNQHYQLLEIVDKFVCREMVNYINHSMFWSHEQKQHALEICTKLDMPFTGFTRNEGKRRKVLSGTYYGTVFSGHPTRTTFGNSLRVYLYTSFIMHLAGIKDYKIWVCGDDMLAIIEKCDQPKFDEMFWKVYSNVQFGKHGLGQCSKGLAYGDQGIASFLSLNIIIDPIYGGRAFRNIPRIQIAQTCSDSRIQDKMLLAKCMAQSIALSGDRLDFVRKYYTRTYNKSFDDTMAKIYGGYKYQMVKSNYVVDSIETDNILLENVSIEVGDLEGVAREVLWAIQQSNDTYPYTQIGGKWSGIENTLGESYFPVQTQYNITMNTQAITIDDEFNHFESSLLEEQAPNSGLEAVQQIPVGIDLYTANQNFKDQLVEHKRRQKIRTVNVRRDRQQKYHQIIGGGKNKSQQQQKVYTPISKEELERRKKQSKRDKNKAKVLSDVNMKQSSNSIQKVQKPIKYTKEHKSDWVQCVLDPFNKPAVRGPSNFLQPTSLLEYKHIIDFTPGQFAANAGYVAIKVSPHYHCQPQSGTNKIAMINIDGGTTLPVNFGVGTNQISIYSIMNQEFGGITSTKRAVSFRLVKCGVKIIPNGSAVTKQGSITIGSVPGLTYDYSANSIPVPDMTQLRQYPTSYECALATLGSQGTSFVWLPLDPEDLIFHSGTVVDHYDETIHRNSIYINMSGLNSTDSFRLVVQYGIEYIPTMTFEPWAGVQISTTPESQANLLKDTVKNNLMSAIMGQLIKTGTDFATKSGFVTGPMVPLFTHLGSALQSYL